MSFLGVLLEKPWQVGPSDTALSVPRPKRIALRFFLGMVTVLFSLFIVTFLARSQFPDFEALAAQPWQPFYNTSQLWWNTGLLLMASVCFQLAFMFGRMSKRQLAVTLVGAAAIFTCAFLLAQWSVWQQLQALGYYVSTNPANSYFYLLTALHGLHLLGGLVVVVALIIRASSDIGSDKLVASIGLSATYCHYLFLVWLVLFALLTSTPETYKTLAGLCGF
ncbi:cytochrome c oxidase subunit 3 [Congregibacter sp.]|jgi:cytochrome c oxidase subunit 3|uniref:cytochrome c oxidase subunit 3 n=1 Tax=Congregibacter sp. TaxID=2744308 RepID=UPI0039E22B47